MPVHSSSAFVRLACRTAVGALRCSETDEMVSGTSACDIEQPDALVEAHLLVDRRPLGELFGDDPFAEPVSDVLRSAGNATSAGAR